MEFVATPEQDAIIHADLKPQCVIACPGSGKTTTAVRRLVKIRERLGDCRGYVALFSYSNVAVDTFKREFSSLSRTHSDLSTRVFIGTVDSFLTTFILRPHASRTMGSSRAPFLVQGAEPFLSGFTISHGTYPRPISELRVHFNGDGSLVYTMQAAGFPPVQIEAWKAIAAIEKLGKVGAYTHELGRYWALRAINENPWLHSALCRRFPHVLVDEAQDVGPLHGTLLEFLTDGGVQVSLIGDPNQGIYEFAGADGKFLQQYATLPGVNYLTLTQNRRSVSAIVNVANHLAGTGSTAIIEPGKRRHGAFYILYDENKLDDVMAAFIGILEANQYGRNEAVVVCRGNATVQKLNGGARDEGVGATALLARSAILRDRGGDIAEAYKYAVDALIRLFKSAPDSLRRDLFSTSVEGDTRVARRLIWEFLRSPANGLPAAKLRAKTSWHPALKDRVGALLDELEAQTGLSRSPSWGHSLTVKKLSDDPLWEADLATTEISEIRVETVHQVKGEGIPAVLYVARTTDISKMLEGTTNEDGRIGYVAATRARELLLLAVPKTAKKEMIEAIKSKGFTSWIE